MRFDTKGAAAALDKSLGADGLEVTHGGIDTTRIANTTLEVQ